MADTLRLVTVRLPQGTYDAAAQLAATDTGGNLSQMIRMLLDDALAARGPITVSPRDRLARVR